MKQATVRAFLTALQGRLTRYSQKQPNPYALSHYLGAVQKTEKMVRRVLDQDDPKAMDRLLAALRRNFIFEGGRFALPPVNQVARMIEQWLTQGKMPRYAGSSLRARVIRAAHDNPELRPHLLPLL